GQGFFHCPKEKSRKLRVALLRYGHTRVGALQPACLAIRDESPKLIMEHAGRDLIPDHASASGAVGKKLPSRKKQPTCVKPRIHNAVSYDDHCRL
ncbi:hypothetical protein, partial [Thalassolituus maritimus]|uniref:hypothetical protein n=1 Tax=Thalassolituus maritimus TaxID=484498 RepID=UPI0033417B60